MAYNERSSETLAELAARYMHHDDPNVRRLAASVLTQAPDHEPKSAMGAPRYYYNGGSSMGEGRRALELYMMVARRQPRARDTIAAGAILKD